MHKNFLIIQIAAACMNYVMNTDIMFIINAILNHMKWALIKEQLLQIVQFGK